MKEETEICPDCGKKAILNRNGICKQCNRRRTNMKYHKKTYIPYIKLSKKERDRIDRLHRAHSKKPVIKTDSVKLTAPDSNDYYTAKANQTKVTTHPISPTNTNTQESFIDTLRDCGCEIPEQSLNDVLEVLINTNKLKDIIMTIAQDDNQQAMLDLEQTLNVAERKLQHDWEYSGFQTEDDKKFKNFLQWRRMLKGAMFFWRKLYQTNTIIEMKKAWDYYTQDPHTKTVLAGDANNLNSNIKRFQITTESISTIFLWSH